MKKILLQITIALTGLLAASCVQEHIEVVFNPGDVTAQTLGNINGCNLAEDGNPLIVDYTPIDFGQNLASTYILYASASSTMADKTKMSCEFIEGNKISIKQKDINSTILNFLGEPDTEFPLYFQLNGYATNDKGSAIASTETGSNIVKAIFTPYDADIMDVDKYEHIWVIGAGKTVGAWSHDKVYQYLYDYDATGNVYTGLIDYGADANGGWKLTGIAGWDNSCNWGSPDQAEEAEPGQVALISSGDSKDIKCYSKRFYKWSFDKTTAILTKVYGFENIGIVGDFNGWAPDDANMKMNYNDVYHRFYIDQTFSSAAQLKFTCDNAWDLNWGVDMVPGGDNIPVDAGNYRIYVDLNKMTYEFNANMFGKEEPGMHEDPVDPKPKAWSLIGTIGGTAWDTDYDLANTVGDVWVIRNVEVTASDEFKIRADHDWAISMGGPEANSKSTIDPANPYDVYKPTLGEAFATGDKNIQIGIAGKYDVTFDYAAGTILINEHKAAFSIIGEINGDTWKNDIVMSQNGDVWTSPVVNITGGFKIRYDYSWDDANCYGIKSGDVPTIGQPFTPEQPGANITVPEAGDYRVIFDTAKNEVTIVAVAYPEEMFMIGEAFGNWDWQSDDIVSLTPVNGKEGEFWCIRHIAAESPFKFCPVRKWEGDFCGLDTNNGFIQDGSNCKVEADDIYMIHIDLKRSILNIEPAKVYGIGGCFGGWDEAMEDAAFSVDGTSMKATLKESGEIRIYAASSISDSDWWTREFIFFDGKIAYRGNGGDQERVSGTAGQTITLDFNAGTAELQ